MTDAPVVAEIVRRHADEAAFLWTLRRRVAVAAHVDLRALAGHDERLEAHLDGLRTAGAAGAEIVEGLFAAEPDAGGAFVRGLWALERKDRTTFDATLAAAGESPEIYEGLLGALAWRAVDEAEIRTLLSRPEPHARRLGLDALIVHRLPPGPALLEACRTPSLCATALRGLGELGLAEHLEAARLRLADPDRGIRFAAARSALLLGRDPAAVAELRGLAAGPEADGEEAARLAARAMPPAAVPPWRETLAARRAVVTAGAAGDPAAVPWLLERMTSPPLARLAGEAFEMITGLDLDRDGLSGIFVPGGAAGPTDDPADPDVAPDPDDDLPWPDPAKVEAAWRGRAGALKPGRRYLMGRDVTADACLQVLRSGRQRQRAAAAMELVLLKPGTPLFNVIAPAARQRAGLVP